MQQDSEHGKDSLTVSRWLYLEQLLPICNFYAAWHYYRPGAVTGFPVANCAEVNLSCWPDQSSCHQLASFVPASFLASSSSAPAARKSTSAKHAGLCGCNARCIPVLECVGRVVSELPGEDPHDHRNVLQGLPRTCKQKQDGPIHFGSVLIFTKPGTETSDLKPTSLETYVCRVGHTTAQDV